MSSSDPKACGLPHREPFIFIDEVREIVAGERAMATKIFHGSEPFFRGHFPGDPLVPGVIVTEALAQTAGIAAGAGSKRTYRLSAIKMMKFLKPVRPGEALFLEAQKIAGIGGLIQFQVTARTAGGPVAEGFIILNEL